MRLNFYQIVNNLRSSYWIKSGTLVLLTRVSIMILGFVSFLILVRYLSKDQFGVWVIYMTIASLIETVRIGFLKSPLMILNSEKDIDKKQLYAASFYLNLGVTLFFIALIVVALSTLGFFYDVILFRHLFALFIVKLIIVSIADHLDLVQETNLEFKGTFQDLISRNLVFVILLILSLIFGYSIKLETLVVFQIIGSSVGVLLTFLNSYIKNIKVLPSIRSSALYLKKYIDLGQFTFGTSLVSITSRNVDTWILGILVSPSAVAIYNPALRLSNIFEIPSNTLSTVLLPQLTRKIVNEGPGSVKYYYERSLAYMLIFMIPVITFFFIFSKEIIFFVVGEGFEDSGDLLKITIFYGLFIPFNRQFTVVMESLGKPKVSFVVIVCTLTVSLLLNYIFVSVFGVFGAAYGSLLSYILVFIVTQIYLRNNFHIRISRVFSHFGPIIRKAAKRFELDHEQ